MITLKQGSVKLNFDGKADIVPMKIKYQSGEYLSGKSAEVFQGKKYRATINISKISKDEYDILETMFFNPVQTEVRLQDGKYFYMLFTDSELTMTEETTDDNELFYYGSINMKE